MKFSYFWSYWIELKYIISVIKEQLAWMTLTLTIGRKIISGIFSSRLLKDQAPLSLKALTIIILNNKAMNYFVYQECTSFQRRFKMLCSTAEPKNSVGTRKKIKAKKTNTHVLAAYKKYPNTISPSNSRRLFSCAESMIISIFPVV